MSRRSRRRKQHKARQQTRQQKYDVGAQLSRALEVLRQGNTQSAWDAAWTAYTHARKQSERESAADVMEEIRFRAALAHKDPEQKLNALTEALAAAPTDARLHFHRGIALLQTGKPGDARLEFTTVAKLDPKREGLAFFRQLADTAAKKAVSPSKSCSPAEQNTLKAVQHAQKRPSKKSAEFALKELLLGPPQLWSALLRLRHDKNVHDFPAMAEFAPAPPSAQAKSILEYYQGVAAMRADAADTADVCWAQALKHGFSESWGRKNRGIVLRGDYVKLAAAGEWPKLADMAKKAPKDLKDDVLNRIFSLAFFHRGYEQARKNQWTQALKSWESAAQWSGNRYLAQNIALAHERLEQWELAAGAWRDMLKRRPRNAGHADYLTDKQVAAIWAHAAECYVNDFCDNEATKCFRKAIEYDPTNIKLRFRLITNYLDKEYWNPNAAIRELNAILEIEPENTDALTHLADLYEKTWQHNAMPVWEKIIRLEPQNRAAREKVINHYLNRIFPDTAGIWYYGPKLTYKQKLAILEDAFKVLPDEPEFIVALGSVHLNAKKTALAKEQYLRAYELAPHNPGIAAAVLQNLIHVKAAGEIERMIPEISAIPALLPGFWVDQGRDALDHPQWARRFFDEALEESRTSEHTTVACILIDICQSILEHGGAPNIFAAYMDKIRAEVPKSGALEYLEGFKTFRETGEIAKARRLLKKAKKLAKAAKETILLQLIENVEGMLSPKSPFQTLNNLFGGLGGNMFEDDIPDEQFEDHIFNELLERMKGFK